VADSPLQPEPVKPLSHRDFTDIDTTRDAIHSGAMEGLAKAYPVQNDNYSLHIENARYHQPKAYSLADQKKAILEQRTLDTPIKGTWTLTDRKTGQTVAKKDKVIARVPYLTHRGTFIYRGNEYTVANQQRLRPGVYARQKDNGELESHVALMPGTGSSFRLHMEPDTGVFKIQAGNAHVPIFSLLKTLGASDSEISKAWGPDLYTVNAGKDDPTTLHKLFAKLADSRTQKAHAQNVSAGLRDTFMKMGLDPEVSTRNLGAPHSRVDKDVLLRATQKLLHIHQGIEEPDDRDSQANQTIHGMEDLFHERLAKDSGRIGRNLLWKSSFVKHLDHIKSGVLTPQLHSVLLTSGMGQPISEINPVEILDQLGRVTRLGQGGIPSVESIPAEARNVSPSQMGFIDGILGPESEKIGVDTRIAGGVRKGNDGQLYQKFVNTRTGQPQYVAARQAVHSTLAFPWEMNDPSRKKVLAMSEGRMKYVPREKVDFAVQHPEHMFALGSNLVPGISGIKGGRLLMGGKMIRQALPLVNAEAPLVQSAHPEGGTYEQRIGEKVGAVLSKSHGIVSRVTPEGITVRYQNGQEQTHELYNHFPFNAKTYIHNTPTVKPGDSVTPGQAIAKSNYTDAKGTLALGHNLRVAYLPYQTKMGNNYEDAIVISDAAAKRLTSEHMNQMTYEPDDTKTVGLNHFLGQFPGRYARHQLAGIDDKGVVRPGTVVHHGDPLVLSVKQGQPKGGSAIHRGKRTYTNDDSLTWGHKHEGIVTDVHHSTDGIKVTVKSFQPMGLGDKMSNRYGGKGVVGAVVPEDHMPKGEDGQAMEVLLNPLGVVSRTNPTQLIETALGKIARKHGKVYAMPAFSTQDATRNALAELAKHGMKESETLFDPHTNRHLKNIFTGQQFFYKLYHTAETKESGRDTGAYTSDEQPAKGGEEGAKRLGMLDINALISHGATEVLKDSKLIRGQKNEKFWTAFRQGLPAPMPESTMIHDKFLAFLKGAGVNVESRAGALHLKALTDRDVDKLSTGPLKSGDAVDAKSNTPIDGGLFDVGLTGGHHGSRWSHIDLHEPLPNPVMEEPIRRVLGLTKSKFNDLLGEPDGAEKIQQALTQLNVPQAIAHQRQVISSGKKSKRDDAIKVLGYLNTAQRTGIHPRDWIMSKAPVLPPAFRPVTQFDGMQLTSDANLLYKDLFEANENLKETKGIGLHPGQARQVLYNALKASSGLGDPVSVENQEKGVGGLLEHVFGKGSSKFGMFQRKILGGTLDVVGRAAITPNPSLDMDHVGLPESKAWTLYRPFIMRRLAQRYNSQAEGGQKVPMTEIAKWIINKDPRAKAALHEEIQARPVLINRAPVWHKFGYMAAWPTLVPGETLHISPLTTPGFGADFDGDAMNYSVPVSDAAVREASEKMLPSRNLLSAKNFGVHMLPLREYLHGLYLATKGPNANKQPRIFHNVESVKSAYLRGEIDGTDPVIINSK
jgi:DNA-directed RNA polymerase beta subunit